MISVKKIDYVTIFLEILNLEGHPNYITGSLLVTAIFLNGWILPAGGASAVEGLRPSGLPRLVLTQCYFTLGNLSQCSPTLGLWLVTLTP